MILCIDIGNTNIVLGIFKKDVSCANWRLATDKGKTEDEYAVLLKSLFTMNGISFEEIEGIIISTVVPPLHGVFEKLCSRFFNIDPLFVGPGIKTGMPIRTDNPREVGPDLVVGGVAAYQLYSRGKHPLIVIDFGTATTFAAISREGEYLGVAIAPGVQISSEALFSRTAMLPRIDLIKPESVIGKNTIQSMQAGIVFGFISMVEGMIRLMKEELGDDTFVVATGGLSRFLAGGCGCIDEINPDLVLEGLRILYEKQRSA